MVHPAIVPNVMPAGTTDARVLSARRGPPPAPACDILVIEDDPAVADLLRLALQSEGHTVDVAADGEEGLTYLQQRRYRLLLLDLLLPGLDGMGVLRALREEPAWRPLVVIILSALQERADVLRALEAGAVLVAGAARRPRCVRRARRTIRRRGSALVVQHACHHCLTAAPQKTTLMSAGHLLTLWFALPGSGVRYGAPAVSPLVA